MRNVTTYRIGAGAGAALILLGVLRNEIGTVVLGGVLALYSLRWARIEREAEARRAFGNVVSLGLISHVQTIRPADDPVRPRK